MNRLTLFRLIRHNNYLAFRRHPAYEQSVVAKVLMVLGAGFMTIYLIMIGTGMGMAANSSSEPGFILALMPLFLAIDFGARFAVQQTPAMLVKPYVLLPLPRHAVIETFLLTSLASGYNWLWLTMFVPYSIIIMAGGANLLVALCILFCGMLLVMANSQFYLLVRTFVSRSLLWWIVPIIIYGGYWVPLVISKDDELFEPIADTLINAAGSWWLPLLCLALLAFLFWVNRTTQFHFVREELSREEKKGTSLKHVSQFSFLERFGQTGEYLKLELKSIMRNKAIRSRVIMSLTLVFVLSILISATNIYDSKTMLNFWCFYCFGIYGMTALTKVMCPEGNYIDLLLTQHENVLQLLRAKYYFHVAILLVPLLLMTPAIIAGKFSLLMVVAYMLLSSGLLYFTLFQLAIYNKQTLPLDQKVTGKNNVENGMQLVIEMLAMFVPLALVALLIFIFNETTAYITLAIVGLAFTLTHSLWLRNIYRRMMARKYENLEGFHATRS
jgi:hypothetical protein